MTYNEIIEYKNRVIDFILTHSEGYQTKLEETALQNISIYCSEGIIESFREVAFKVLGYSIKDSDSVEMFAKICGIGTAKMHDIFIDIEAIEEACKLVNENYGFVFELDDAIKCIITHELMHTISVGFAYSNGTSDEAHTDYLAKRIYEAFYPGKQYFTAYEYPMPPKLLLDYQNEIRKITEESIQRYFLGDSTL